MAPLDPPITDGDDQAPSVAVYKTQIRRSVRRFEAGEEDGAIRAAIRTVTRAEAHGIALSDLVEAEELPAELRAAVSDALADSGDAGDALGGTGAAAAVDTSGLKAFGTGGECLYAYGFAGYPDRLRIGMTADDTPERRIAQQLGAGIPDRPKLHVIYRCRDARRLERAVHAILDCRDRRLVGTGPSWFLCSVEDLLEIIAFVVDTESSGG
ncbi:MAG: GIY-YIG nuclease family protein [Pseudomonadota bacterium]